MAQMWDELNARKKPLENATCTPRLAWATITGISKKNSHVCNVLNTHMCAWVCVCWWHPLDVMSVCSFCVVVVTFMKKLNSFMCKIQYHNLLQTSFSLSFVPHHSVWEYEYTVSHYYTHYTLWVIKYLMSLITNMALVDSAALLYQANHCYQQHHRHHQQQMKM